MGFQSPYIPRVFVHVLVLSQCLSRVWAVMMREGSGVDDFNVPLVINFFLYNSAQARHEELDYYY